MAEALLLEAGFDDIPVGGLQTALQNRHLLLIVGVLRVKAPLKLFLLRLKLLDLLLTFKQLLLRGGFIRTRLMQFTAQLIEFTHSEDSTYLRRSISLA